MPVRVSIVRWRSDEPTAPEQQRLSPLARTLGATGNSWCFILTRGAFLRMLHQTELGQCHTAVTVRTVQS